MSGPDLDGIAARHGLARDAVAALAEAVRRGRGGVQWDHPGLGGLGQWSGGMIQIGDMFNDGLKARVAAAIVELQAATSPASAVAPTSPPSGWWPAELGMPSASGSQDGMRYACFPERRRLAIEQDGRLTLYDTGPHRLTGFAQQQGLGGTVSFAGPDGTVRLDELVPIR